MEEHDPNTEDFEDYWARQMGIELSPEPPRDPRARTPPIAFSASPMPPTTITLAGSYLADPTALNSALTTASGYAPALKAAARTSPLTPLSSVSSQSGHGNGLSRFSHDKAQPLRLATASPSSGNLLPKYCPQDGCTDDFPQDPSNDLLELLRRPLPPKALRTRGESVTQKWTYYNDICQQIKYELRIEEARRAGWPTILDYSDILRRVQSAKTVVESLITAGTATIVAKCILDTEDTARAAWTPEPQPKTTKRTQEKAKQKGEPFFMVHLLNKFVLKGTTHELKLMRNLMKPG